MWCRERYCFHALMEVVRLSRSVPLNLFVPVEMEQILWKNSNELFHLNVQISAPVTIQGVF